MSEVNTQLAPDQAPSQQQVDTAHMGVECHLLIRDADTGENIVNQRG